MKRECIVFIFINDIDDTESNVCTKSQVAAIKAKGWTPYYYGTFMTTWGDTLEGWLEYEGMDENANAISQPTIEGIDKNAPIYNLAGQRIENLQGKKGVYIVGGKKVLIQ